MDETVDVTGVVAQSAPAGEYDRRLVLITRELGKITVFAGGARRPTCPYLAACRTFTFARFTLHQTPRFYRLREASIADGMEELSKDFEAVSYGMYFLELALCYTEENVEAEGVVNLLYVSFRALMKASHDRHMIRAVFEMRMLREAGEAPQIFTCLRCHRPLKSGAFILRRSGMLCDDCANGEGIYLQTGAAAALQYAQNAPLEKLFCFKVSDGVGQSVCSLMKEYCAGYVGRDFKSLKLLDEPQF